MVVIITLLAFVVNVGMYVKAKINLQNATDAAAWSGAAVQSRQLTNIAYLNWEMRNIYKEWMFKYYVLGNLTRISNNAPNGSTSNFKMDAKDPYNIPSICIHFAGTSDICREYDLPGLPRFEAGQFPGVQDVTRAYIDALAETKADNCSGRSKVNFLTAAAWTYGVPASGNSIANDAPQIAIDRPGAFPKALELSFRIRNLEKLVNRPPVPGVCHSMGNSPDGACRMGINSLTQDAQSHPENERTVKAFYSAYRNIGNNFDNEMKESFTLTELAPQEFSGQGMSYHPILDASDKAKYYLDLQITPVNYSIFYTGFVTRGGRSGNTTVDAGCSATKLALPIPGYPLGFYKNSNVLTYYAVKGEAKFVGLFNPFKGEYTKLTAYSAAKPFGGRIGPALFQSKGNYTLARTGKYKRSSYYAMSLDLIGAPKIKPGGNGVTEAIESSDNFALGAPLPIRNFWVDDSGSALSGEPGSSGNIRYVYPNMIYDLSDGHKDSAITDAFLVYAPGTGGSSLPAAGLYNDAQLKSFMSKIPNPNAPLTPQIVEDAINKARAPTDYESKHWMIPTPFDFNQKNQLDAFGAVTSDPDPNGRYSWQIYAPLFGTAAEFQSVQETIAQVDNYLEDQRESIEAYLDSLKAAADQIIQSGLSSNLDFTTAANAIYSTTGNNTVASHDSLRCDSIAGKFYHYYLGALSGTNCPIPFKQNLDQFWSDSFANNESFAQFYQSDYYTFPEEGQLNLLSAYGPGKNQGATSNNSFQVVNPFISHTELARRNYYSTKFIPLKELMGNSGAFNAGRSRFAIFSEGEMTPDAGDDVAQKALLNSLSPTSVPGLDKIPY